MRTPRILPVTLLAVACAASLSFAKPPGAAGNAGPTVNLPQTMVDPSGYTWMIYQQGCVQTSGNNPLYGQSAQVTVNGNQPGNGRNPNRARLDEKTGELIFDLPAQQGVGVTRRVLLDKKGGYVRYVDILKNTRQQDQTVNYQLTTNLNFGVNSAEIVDDPRKADRPMALVAQTDGPAVAVELYASKNAKVVPSIDWQPGNNTITVTYQVPVPAGKQVGLLHLHTLSPSTDTGVMFVSSLKESKLTADLPADLRKSLVNFTVTGGMAGDYEVLRGTDLLDVVELRGGDQYKGTLQVPAYHLQTPFGPVDLSADRLVGLINVGDTRPRQLLITTEGEIFGGHLTAPSPNPQSAAPSIPLQLSSGQITQIPLSQISRLGYRKRPGEPEDWPLTKPMITLRTGDRMQIDLPKESIPVATRYGHLSLSAQSVAALVLASEDHAVHEIVLADGSRFAGLVDAGTFTLTLSGPKQEVKFPANAVTHIQFAVPQDPDPSAAILDLSNGDKLVGQLSSRFKLDTAFDTLTINGPEVKRLTHPDPNAPDVQVTLWDDSTLSGQLEQPDLPVVLNSGLSLAIPAALIGDYANPQPAPSPAMADKIKALVTDLGADDYHRREQAEAALTAIGPSVLRTLNDLKPTQPPEAQQRIDSILKQVDKKPDKSHTPADRNAR